MFNRPLSEILSKLALEEMEQTRDAFTSPLGDLLPEKRLRRIVPLAIRGILTNETPVVAAMAQRTVAQATLPYLLVALDPVNFEKPYTKHLEGVSTGYKKTPPNLEGKARLARGYPAMTATVVNTPVPAISYANWFFYQTSDLLSQNREIQRSIRTTRWVFPDQSLRFVMERGGDDQKVFAWIEQAQAEFVITATHLERLVEVYNPRLDRWETERLPDLVECVLWEATFATLFGMRSSGQAR